MDCNVLHTYEALLIMITLPAQRLIAVLFTLKICQSLVHRRPSKILDGWMDG